MMTRQVEWLNSNRYRRYPFEEDAALTAIANDAILDFSLIHYSLCELMGSLQSITVLAGAPGVATFTFLIQDQAAATSTISFDVPEDADFPYVVSAYLNGGVPGYGTCVFGEGALAVFTKPDGTYPVTEAPALEPALFNSHCRLRVSTITSTEAGSTAVKNDVQIKEGHNCQVTILPDSDTVKIAAIRGSGEGIVCTPPVDRPVCKDVLLRVNGLQGDNVGGFIIKGGDSVSVVPEPENNRIIIKSTAQVEDNACGG